MLSQGTGENMIQQLNVAGVTWTKSCCVVSYFRNKVQYQCKCKIYHIKNLKRQIVMNFQVKAPQFFLEINGYEQTVLLLDVGLNTWVARPQYMQHGRQY